ncbi:Reverse transcriptase [Phytophthora palmivora]|uniref:Reverse transcriptase n=1 Tax=Phytophthora palmivora TaxID=4796 RepID=A0A2P4XVW8_9STRA|nr:Reverse transcriptase [Phytophthora palmivora]
MDHIPSLPRSHKGNTELLIWIDLFTGYVIAKANASRTAQTVTENYEECVFSRFGESEDIRHGREPGFMSDFFRSFSKIVGQRQQATMAYRPQANGTTERIVGTLTRAVKMYVEDDRAEDEIVNPVGGDIVSRSNINKLVSRLTRDYVKRSKKGLIDTINRSDPIQSKLELKCDRVKEGYARKLAHTWNGPFRVLEIVCENVLRLTITSTEYRLFPVVHNSQIKPVRHFPERP